MTSRGVESKKNKNSKIWIRQWQWFKNEESRRQFHNHFKRNQTIQIRNNHKKMEENKNQEPKMFKVLRILAPCLLFVGVLLIVLGCTVFRADKSVGDGDMANLGLIIPGIFIAFLSVPSFFIGFMPKISKTMARANMYISEEVAPEMIKTHKRIQQENKEDLTDISNTGADISSEAITKTTRAIKKGLKDTKFCKHCGTEIDADSTFCKSCGGEQ